MITPHNAPPHIINAMRDDPGSDLFRAAAALGERLTWKGTPKRINSTSLGIDNTPTCWSLDGGKTHATHGEIMEKAGLK